MILTVLKKMFSNIWLYICLITGSLIAVAIVSSIPVYTQSVLYKMLIKDLEAYQLNTGNYPGKCYVEASFDDKQSGIKKQTAYLDLNAKISECFNGRLGVPISASQHRLTINYMAPDKGNSSYKIDSLSDIGGHIRITNGRLFSAVKTQGIYEAIVTKKGVMRHSWQLGKIYELKSRIYDDFIIKIKVVGVFDIKDNRDLYWNNGIDILSDSLVLDQTLFKKDFIQGDGRLLSSEKWFNYFDYYAITLDAVNNISYMYKKLDRELGAHNGVSISMPAVSIINQYAARQAQLKTALWILNIPILIMLVFYIFMVSRLIIEHDGDEIAVLKSRGCSSGQIFLRYLCESMIIGLIAIAAGPFLGLSLSKVIGFSNGFMEFVQRTALPAQLDQKAYLYAAAAVLLTIVTMLIPAYLATKNTIVTYKQKKNGRAKVPLWRKFFLDLILIAISVYSVITYRNRLGALAPTDVKSGQNMIDPLLYAMSVLFVMGCGLLFLRCYSFLINFVFRLGRRIWPPVLYSSFAQVGRSSGKSQFLMLFLVITMSIGIYNANSAQIINTGYEDNIRYETGADIVISPAWDTSTNFMLKPGAQNSVGVTLMNNSRPSQLNELPMTLYEGLNGVKSATKVLKKDDIQVKTVSGIWIDKVKLMGIEPYKFGKTAWFRPNLLAYHWYYYLNFMTRYPDGVYISRSLQEKYDIREGDIIELDIKNYHPFQAVILGFVDYWPSYSRVGEVDKDNLVVASLQYVQSMTAIEPYDIWIKKAQGATSGLIYAGLSEKKAYISAAADAQQEIIKKKNDGLVKAINGVLSLGFLAAMLISLIGFLIFWILSIKKRILQFGVLRAIGLAKLKMILIIIIEHILISGVSVLMGLVTGSMVSRIFIPLFQTAYVTSANSIPLNIVFRESDYTRVYTTVAFILLIGIAIFWIFISRIRIHQAIKLGEE